MVEKTLSDWLIWIQSQHKKEIDLGLTRVAAIAKRLNIIQPPCPVITVGGTNGKGSTVAGLEAIYRSAGYKVGAFVSPILFKHNEYVRIQGENPSDAEFCQAFERVEAARDGLPITFFEFNALAAFDLFLHADLDVWILEVGLGGRLDAVNIMDPDVAMITTVAIDHAEWLGSTRELIGREKAGIFRKNKPAICGDFDVPQSVRQAADAINAPLFCQGQEFGFQEHAKGWSFWHENLRYDDLPKPKLALQNMATTLMGVTLLQNELPISAAAIETGLQTVSLPGRIQKISGPVTHIYDVSHNPAAAEFLAQHLHQDPISGKTIAVFSMLGDKDIVSTLQAMKAHCDKWHIAVLESPRAASMAQLQQSFQSANIAAVTTHASIAEAYQAALGESIEGDRVVIFGSFVAVSSVLKASKL